ncbi:hypothetical protein MTsN2n6_35690 [Vibrio fortis]
MLIWGVTGLKSYFSESVGARPKVSTISDLHISEVRLFLNMTVLTISLRALLRESICN